ncbi:hypothetical protein PANT_22d00251, partial [Moesziomyces antarcticus T-34]
MATHRPRSNKPATNGASASSKRSWVLLSALLGGLQNRIRCR